MHSDLEHTLIGELDDVASNLVVPPLPNLPVTSSGRRRWRLSTSDESIVSHRSLSLPR